MAGKASGRVLFSYVTADLSSIFPKCVSLARPDLSCDHYLYAPAMQATGAFSLEKASL